ncbi:universal stress protein [Mucilaginibacter sp. BT774]|uniref:universal stress protein n=1 Tax=Mucilaginibacter sp. BT774 TaxID=3062276 RepID=UPI002675555E|nr:universal stress protein [Mucilaginibacter sp. BT774]MDO3627306.1 universal stress protein [Mucilaginibacter sp. BT774]
MRTILVFNDDSPEAINAAEFALHIAKKVKADIFTLNLVKRETYKVSEKLIAAYAQPIDSSLEPQGGLVEADEDFKPAKWEIDASQYSEKEISELVIRKNVWLMVKGIETQVTHELLCQVDIQAILNHVGCPLLLIPDNYKKRNFENIAYAVDMRYCRRTVLKFLTELAKDCGASLVLEHLSAKGLPPLDDKYAMSLFDNEITNKTYYNNVYFNNIKERNLNVAIGVIINDLQADLLAVVNHRFHFEELFGRAIKTCMPENIPIPVIVFPL